MAEARDAIEVTATPIPLAEDAPDIARVGALDWRGGLELSSPDRHFGGLSGLAVAADGAEMLAVSDKGRWFGARLVFDDEGWLTGLDGAWMARLLDADGKALRGKIRSDAEELLALPGGGYLVAFERRHRLRRYDGPDAPAVAVPAPDLGALPVNGGIEALGALPGGRLLALTESYFIVPGGLAGWVFGGGQEMTLIYPCDGYFRPTALAVLDDGRVLVLERGYNVIRGVRARLMLLEGGIEPGAHIAPRELARFEPPLAVDNFEGLSARRAADGTLLLYVVSDDNFRDRQRTLLLMFALAE